MIENETSFGDRVTNYTEDRFGNKNAAIDFIGL